MASLRIWTAILSPFSDRIPSVDARNRNLLPVNTEVLLLFEQKKVAQPLLNLRASLRSGQRALVSSGAERVPALNVARNSARAHDSHCGHSSAVRKSGNHA